MPERPATNNWLKRTAEKRGGRSASRYAATVEQLDHLADEQSNSIGALLFHIGAVEVGYQAHTFFGRGLDADEMREWGSGIELGDAVRRDAQGHDLEYYFGRLERLRAPGTGKSR